jgi:alpha 1,3-glucosidase
VVTSLAGAVAVTKPPGRWYDFFTGKELLKDETVPVALADIPVYIRGGKIVPQFSQAGMSTKEMLGTPLTLHIALDGEQKAAGELYLDDGETYNYTKGVFLRRRFVYEQGTLKSEDLGGEKVPEELKRTKIDQVVLYGGEQGYASYQVDLDATSDFSAVLPPVDAESTGADEGL